MVGLERERIAEVWATAGGNDGTSGSGYLIDERHILTAAHVVAPATTTVKGACEVRCLGQQVWRRARVLDHAPALDVALLELEEPSDKVMSPIRWGRIVGTQGVDCSAVGFPEVQRRPDGVRNSEQIEARIQPLSMAKTDQLAVNVRSGAPRDPSEHQTLWAGMSGAAVFTDEALVGIIITDPQGFGPERLVATSIAKVASDRALADSFAMAGIALRPEPVFARDKSKITEDTYDVSDLGHNPYLGLASYSYEERAFYGGREPQIRDAVQRLTAPGDELVLLFVTGASGSGKSSFAQAGLLPALEEAYTAQGRQVRRSVMRPGRHPIAALGRALEDLGFSQPSDGDWTALFRTPEDLNLLLATQTPQKQINVLILDQFEELFTQSELVERDAACGLLSRLDTFGHMHTHVIATLRADYLPALFNVGSLFDRAKHDGVELREMSSDELAEAIRRPIQEEARLEGKDKRLAPALVERLVEDVGGDPALLPLLQVTLRALWDEPPHRMILDRRRYRSLTSTLEQQANRLIDQDRRGHERAAVEREELLGILLDLVEVSLDDDPKRDVRRALPKQDVLHGHPERTELIEELVNARMVTTWVEQREQTPVEMIDIIHETLLASWPRLRDAIAAKREDLQQRERFRLALREWLQRDRSDQYVLKDVRLAEARMLAKRNDVVLGDPDGRAFFEQSSRTEAQSRTRRQRILAVSASMATLLAAAALVAAAFAVSAQQRAEQQARVAISSQLAAQALNHTDQLDLALLLGVEAYEVEPTPESRHSLLTMLQQLPQLQTFLHQPSVAVTAVAATRDAQTLAIASVGGTITLWDVVRRQPRGAPLCCHTNLVSSMAFSPDGTLLASGSCAWERIASNCYDGEVRLWTVADGQQAGEPLQGNIGDIHSLEFSPNGDLLAAGVQSRIDPSGVMQLPAVMLWEIPNRKFIAALSPPGVDVSGQFQSNSFSLVAFSPDGQTLATGSQQPPLGRGDVPDTGTGLVALWDVDNQSLRGSTFSPFNGSVHALALSPDGTTLAVAGGQSVPNTAPGYDDVIKLWDVTDRTQIGDALTGFRGYAAALTFSSDGRMLAAIGGDTVTLWSISPAGAGLTGPNAVTGRPRTLSIVGAAAGEFAGRAHRLVIGLGTGVMLLDLDRQLPLATPLDIKQLQPSFLSPDGSIVGLVGCDFRGASGCQLRVLDVPTGALRQRVLDFPGPNTPSAVTADNKLLASIGCDQQPEKKCGVQLWNLETMVQIAEAPLPATSVESLSFSPDGYTLAVVGDQQLALWDVRGRQPIRTSFAGTEKDAAVAKFSANGKQVAVGSNAHLSLFDASSGLQLLPALDVRAGSLPNFAFSSDEETVAVARPGEVVLWNTRTRATVSVPLPAEDTGGGFPVAFGKHGQLLATAGCVQGGEDGCAANEIRLWDPSSRQPIGAALVRTAPGEPVTDLAFSNDGKTLTSMGSSGVARWEVDPEAWADRACRLANRDLTLPEWERYRPGVPYKPTCTLRLAQSNHGP